MEEITPPGAVGYSSTMRWLALASRSSLYIGFNSAISFSMKEFKATVRNIPRTDHHDGPGKCIITGEPVDRRVVIAKAY